MLGAIKNMNTLFPILIMAGTFAIVTASAVVIGMLMNSSSRVRTKLAGMWINESQTIRILIHEIDSVFQGDIIWVNEIQKSQILGFSLIQGLAKKSFAQGCKGVYVDPTTMVNNPFQIWFQGSGRLKMVLTRKVNGRDEVLREEKWFKI